VTEEKKYKNQVNEEAAFTVPTPFEEIKEDKNITTTNPSTSRKNYIINQAFKFHSQGNIQQAKKYYQYFLDKGYIDHRVYSNYGIILKGLGKLKEAEILYRKAIKYKPKFAKGYCNLGSILLDLGKLKEAETLTRVAIKLKPNFENAHLNLGNILRNQSKLEEAEISACKAIEIKPDFGNAYYLLGNIYKDLGKLKKAEISLRKAIELKPNFAEAYSTLGTILKKIGELKEAEILQRKAISIEPDLSHINYNLANTLIQLGKIEEAEVLTRKAIKLKHNYAEAYSNLGIIVMGNNLLEAEKYTRKAIRINPNYAIAHSNLGTILKNLGNLKEAELSTRKAIELKPSFAEAHSNLGSILIDLNHLNEAEISTRKAITIKSDYGEAYTNLAHILRDLGQYESAINYYRKAIELNNGLSSAKTGLIGTKREICNWDDQDTEKEWIKDLGINDESVIPFDFFFLEDNALNHLKRSKKLYMEKFIKRIYPLSSFKNKKIRIGYFSADFKEHATMFLISSILELHNKKEFEIYLYSFTHDNDKYTEKATKFGCIFKDIRKLSDIEAVELARKDKLDIAIDLKGYTQHSRMNIFSYRVAKVQINYLGYPGTLGSDAIDYIIADDIVIPKQNEQFYSEKVIRMPNCYQCNDNKKAISTANIFRRNHNLPEEGFIFTCFNSNKKISSNEFDIWMRLLKSIKGSVLWLYKSNKWSIENLRKEAEKRNVNSNKIIFANKLRLDQHLSRHSLGDLGLDTFNCNGHTTTSDALWAGLPVLTKIGESFAARVSASLLTTIEMSELITYTEKEYEEKAVFLANNPGELVKLKSKLSKKRNESPLFNSQLYTKDLEIKFKELIFKTNK